MFRDEDDGIALAWHGGTRGYGWYISGLAWWYQGVWVVYLWPGMVGPGGMGGISLAWHGGTRGYGWYISGLAWWYQGGWVDHLALWPGMGGPEDIEKAT